MLSVEYWIERTAKMLEQQVNELRQHIAALLREYPELENDEFLRADMIEGATNAPELLTALHHMVEDARALRDGTQGRLDELNARKQRMQKRIDFGRDLIARVLEAAGTRKAELAEVTLSLKANPQRLIGEVDPDSLPDELVKITRSADKQKIREWLERGVAVDGYQLSNASPSLMVRIK